ncbi:MAG: hypothetical protein JO168_13345 [Solirubrobacterales bacterium]|nr:hypothetical protein [Solirubrobacterales bacterium]MBV9715824.1 hypothetical protein [Solirubrobacterales bacterium]
MNVGEAGAGPWGHERPSRLRAPRRRRIDRFELGVLAVFAGLSLWVLGLDLWQVIAHGRVWTGTDGLYVVDQLQYLAWIQDASHHLLSGNLFVLRSTSTDYFQPAVEISAVLTALGLAPWLSLILWKPVAVVAAFFAVRAYCDRSLVGRWPLRAALVLGLFFGSFSIVDGDFTVVGDLFLGFLSWGYTFGLLAVALMAFAILEYDRGRTAGRITWKPAVLGATAAILHPWQGELLIVILLGAELAMWRGTRRRPARPALPIVTVAVTGLPLLYYLILGHTDLSWQLARDASKHGFSLWAIVLGLAPLAIPAALAYRGRSVSFLTSATRIWPFAALAVWVLSATELSATPLHAFNGVTIPLAVLAVRGAQRLRLHRVRRPRAVAAAAVTLMTVPATVYLLAFAANHASPQPANANFIARDEKQALRYLAKNPEPGGVVASSYLGEAVPAETGRKTYYGDCLWSEPGCYTRIGELNNLFGGSLPDGQAEAFIRSTGARFVLADCGSTPDLDRQLAPLTVAVTRFGCSSVYELDTPSRPSEPLAESAGDAALRATGRQQRASQSS